MPFPHFFEPGKILLGQRTVEASSCLTEPTAALKDPFLSCQAVPLRDRPAINAKDQTLGV